MNKQASKSQFSETADRVSDKIVDLINSELKEMQDSGRMEPYGLLAGHILGMLSFMRTCPPENEPDIFRVLKMVSVQCLTELQTYDRIKQHQSN
jgi:hypothetical protein